MLSSAETIVPSQSPEMTTMATTSTTLYFDPLYDRSASNPTVPRSFKRHKTLPHPRAKRGERLSNPQRHSLASSIESATASSHISSPQSSAASIREYEEPGIRAPGPDLPPTPPTHSRSSSEGQSAIPSSPAHAESLAQTPANASSRTPGTPPNQRSPPTPDVTPPKAARRPTAAIRPLLADRLPSKATTVDSRTASFTTARENPSSEEDERSSENPTPYLERTGSQSTVRPVVASTQERPQDVDVQVALESGPGDKITPRTKPEFFSFDGEWTAPKEVEQDNLHKNVAARERRVQPETKRQRREVIDNAIATPTNATKAVRSMPLQDRALGHHSTTESVDRARRWLEPSNSESSSSTNVDARRSSVMSSRSTVSTVVEAVLIEAQPRRQKTLRHVKKRMGLRESNSDFSASSSVSTSLTQPEPARRPRAPLAGNSHRSEKTASQVSTGTMNSVSSSKARREVWKNGGIPVVVIPDRATSLKATRAPSLRPAGASQPAKRSNSLSSAQLPSRSKNKDLTPLFDRPPRRGRALSESDGSFPIDELTMDYPPIVPLRRSSLSAPTSRNGSRASSRAGSLTAESLQAHNALQQEQQPEQEQESRRTAPQATVERAPSFEYMSDHLDLNRLEPVASAESHSHVPESNRPVEDHNGDPFFGKRLTLHHTPFSQASVETSGTHSVADISEAMAVNIYPHQNKSVLMVHHLSKPPDSANAPPQNSPTQAGSSAVPEAFRDTPEIRAHGPGGGPVTPPRFKMSMDDVDSPLRNPRAPPMPPGPPALQFTPATPSGLTPAAEKEKMLGNFFEETQKRPSLVRRAFSLRKNSDTSIPRGAGFLSRTLSGSRHARKDTVESPTLGKGKSPAVSRLPPAVDDDEPLTDETKLHPFWRPASQIDSDDDENMMYDDDEDDDNRPAPPRRSLSLRMKNAFTILPVQNDAHYNMVGHRSPERRTIKRSPSGHLRVMRSRGSYSSLRWSSSYPHEAEGERPSTAPDRPIRRAWTEKRVDSKGRRFFPGWQDKVQQYGIQNLQRRFSEHRRQKRTQELRQKISGPREVRDGVGEVIKRNSYQGPSYQNSTPARVSTDDSFGPPRRRSTVQ